MDGYKFALGILLIYFASSCAYKLEETHLDNISNVPSTVGNTSGCQCSTYSCGCCENVNVRWLVTGLVCTNFSVLPNDYGISFVITFNNYTVINETFSVRNPPPMCIGIPELEKVNAEICLRLYNLEFKNSHFSGCVAVQVAVYHFIHKSVTVGCFNLPPERINIIPLFKSAADSLTVKKKIYKDNYEIDLEEIKNMPTVQQI